MNQFNLSIKIGTGSYAVVQLGIDKETSQKVAIKIYDKKIFEDPYKLKNVKREIQILTKLKHPNIIKLFHVIENQKDVNLVMEYVGLTTLFTFLKQNSQKRLTETVVRKIFYQIASGLDYMHKKNISHRDIKLENLLLSDDNQDVKIIDFGFSIYTPPEKKLTSFCGTPSYMAPEIISKSEYSGPPVDIWCLGVLLYVLMCGQFPFKGKDEKELYQRITECQIDLPIHVPEGAKVLLKNILQINPQARPTSQQIMEDPWIKGDYESEHFFSDNEED